MRRLASIAFVGTQIIAPPQAMAADASAQYEIMPPGAVSCASWTQGRDEAGRGYTVLLTEEGVLRAEREGWVAGYISALNVEILPNDRGATRDLAEGVARDEIMTSIDDYCAENPLHSLLSATASVSLELANAWLVAHPASGAPGGQSARLPTAGLPPDDQNISASEEIAPPVSTPQLLQTPSSTAPEAAPLPAPVPAVTAPAPPPPMPTPTPPPAMPVPDSSEGPPVVAAPPPAPPPPPTVAAEPVPGPPPELRGAVSALAGGAILQVGAFRTDALAGQAWEAFLAEHRDVLADLLSDIQEVDLGASGVWHRLRVGPFTDRDEANALCSILKARGADCFAAAP